ncbi:hypothetical protein FJY84_08125 [Candidatus Bathyarchaeota archaeon]|nr:hypothetical protein [Candidatus Bathyarchaeota archaeon]
MVELGLIEIIPLVSQIATAFGVCIAATYYVLNLRNNQKNMQLTLETRQAQLFMNIYDKTSKREFTESWRKFMAYKFSNYNEFRELYQNNHEFQNSQWELSNVYEGLGVLVKEGLLPIRMVALLMTGMFRGYWEKFIPIYDDAVKDMGFSRWLSETKFLYEELMRYLAEHPELDSRIKRLIRDPGA